MLYLSKLIAVSIYNSVEPRVELRGLGFFTRRSMSESLKSIVQGV